MEKIWYKTSKLLNEFDLISNEYPLIYLKELSKALNPIMTLKNQNIH